MPASEQLEDFLDFQKLHKNRLQRDLQKRIRWGRAGPVQQSADQGLAGQIKIQRQEESQSAKRTATAGDQRENGL